MPPLYDDSRAAWSARPNTNPRTVAPTGRTGVSWHYPGGALTITPESAHSRCLTQTLAWQRFHQADRGWADIGYNLLICQHARVIEGRGADLVGAHSPGVNVQHYGVQFMVSGDTMPTPAMLDRAVRLRADLEARSKRTLRQWGHRDDPTKPTACPGDKIEAWVKARGPYQTPNTESEPPMSLTSKQVWQDDGNIAAPDYYETIEATGKPPENTHWTPANYVFNAYKLLQQIAADVRAIRAGMKQ